MRVNHEYYGKQITCINFTTLQTWRYKCNNNYISNIFTITDEALAMLALENCVDNYQRIISIKRK